MSIRSASLVTLIVLFCQNSHQKPVDTHQYSDCGSEFRCFGIPKGCVESSNCEVLVKTQPTEGGDVSFELTWDRPQNESDRYVAIGLSTDQQMGDDSTTLFWLDQNNTVQHTDGLTWLNKTAEKGAFHPYETKGINVQRRGYKNGVLSAKWTRVAKTTVNKETFDLNATKYYIFLAKGPVDEENHIKHHSAVSMSADAIDLESEPEGPTTTTPTGTAAHTTAKSTGTTAPTTKADTTSGTSKSTGTGTPSTAAPTTAQPTGTATQGNSTVSPTTNNSTDSHTTEAPKPSTTPKPKGSASTAGISLVLMSFVTVLVIFT